MHRSGRTARAGASGDAISFACEKYVFGLPEIETFIGHKIPTAVADHDVLPPIEIPPRAPRAERPDRERGRGRERGGRRGERSGRPERAERRPQQEARAPKPEPVAATPAPPPPAAAKPANRPPKSRPKTILRRGERPVIG